MEVYELSVRDQPVGPPLAHAVKLSAPGPQPALNPDPKGRAAIVILIHGYNNCYSDAKAAFETFLLSLRSCALSDISLPIYQFFWPGDERNKILSALSYANQIPTVRVAAGILNAYLRTLHGPDGGPIDVHFVAHSLGNRLLINLLNIPSFPVSVRVRSVTLMAAAVPVNFVGYGEDLYKGCLLPSSIQCFHSRSDDVLHWAFPAGETLAGESFFPTAIGRFGEPAGNWRSSFAFDTFTHGDYWLKPGPPNLVLQSLGYTADRITRANGTASRATSAR